jgi:Zn-finger nucleic acid-binding protein
VEFATANDDGVTPFGEPAEHDCPACRTPLARATVEGFSTSYCATCRGVLLSNPVFADVLPRRRARLADRPPAVKAVEPDELRRRVGCPSCGAAMDTHPYGGGGNVVIDSCHRCRLVWLDAGELETLARHRPGRDRAFRVEPAAALAGSIGAGAAVAPGFRRGGTGTEDDTGGDSLWSLLGRLFSSADD